MHSFINSIGNQNNNSFFPSGDYIPVISTFHTMMMLYRRTRLYYEDSCGAGSKTEHLIYDYNYALANNRSLIRCIAPLVPVIGNLFAYGMDTKMPENCDPVHLLKKTIREASRDDKLKMATSLAQTDVQILVENISEFATDNPEFNAEIANIFLTIQPEKNARFLPDCVGKLNIGLHLKLIKLFKSVAAYDLGVVSVEGACKFFGDRETFEKISGNVFFQIIFSSPAFDYCRRAKEAGNREKLAMAKLLVSVKGKGHLLDNIDSFSTGESDHDFQIAELIFKIIEDNIKPLPKDKRWGIGWPTLRHPFLANLKVRDLENKMKLALFFSRNFPNEVELYLKHYGITLEDVLAFSAEVKKEIFPAFSIEILREMARMGSEANKLIIADTFCTKKIENLLRLKSRPDEETLGALLELGQEAISLTNEVKEEFRKALDQVTTSIFMLDLDKVSRGFKKNDPNVLKSNVLKLMFAKSLLLANKGGAIKYYTAVFMTEDEEHNFELAKLFVTTPNNKSEVSNASYLADGIDQFKVSDPFKRLQLAKMAFEIDQEALAKNIEKFDLTPVNDSEEFLSLPLPLILLLEPNPSPDRICTLARRHEQHLRSRYNSLREDLRANSPLQMVRSMVERQRFNLPFQDLIWNLRMRMKLPATDLIALFSLDSLNTNPLLVYPDEVFRVSYLGFLRDSDFRWVIPFIRLDEFRFAVCTYPTLFTQLMPLVTTELKDAFFRDAALHQQIVEWSLKRWQARIASGKGLNEVQKEWSIHRLSLMQVIAMCSKTLNTLSKLKLTPELMGFIESVKNKLEIVEKEMDMVQELITAQRKASKDLVEIPDEFLCPILGVPMQRPMRLKNSEGTCEYEAWAQSNGKSPFNREPFELTDLIVDADLKARIDTWKKEHPHAWDAAL